MHKREIIRLGVQIQEKGLTVIPLKVYFKQGKAKIQIALARGKQKADKRDAIKERDAKREIDRAIKDAKAN